jgi:hypothetical protein
MFDDDQGTNMDASIEFGVDQIVPMPRVPVRGDQERARRRAELRREWESELDRVAFRAALRSRSLIVAMVTALAIVCRLAFLG